MATLFGKNKNELREVHDLDARKWMSANHKSISEIHFLPPTIGDTGILRVHLHSGKFLVQHTKTIPTLRWLAALVGNQTSLVGKRVCVSHLRIHFPVCLLPSGMNQKSESSSKRTPTKILFRRVLFARPSNL